MCADECLGVWASVRESQRWSVTHPVALSLTQPLAQSLTQSLTESLIAWSQQGRFHLALYLQYLGPRPSTTRACDRILVLCSERSDFWERAIWHYKRKVRRQNRKLRRQNQELGRQNQELRR